MIHQPHLTSSPFRRTSVRLLLVAWMVVLVAPCVNCLPSGHQNSLPIASALAAAPAAPVAPAAAAEAGEDLADMPADCPMHAKHSEAANAPAAAEPVAPAEQDSAPDCPQPSDCCLTEGANAAAMPEAVAAPAAPAAVVAEVVALAEVPLPAPLFLRRELGSDRSHAPPAFNRPLRN